MGKASRARGYGKGVARKHATRSSQRLITPVVAGGTVRMAKSSGRGRKMA